METALQNIMFSPSSSSTNESISGRLFFVGSDDDKIFADATVGICDNAIVTFYGIVGRDN